MIAISMYLEFNTDEKISLAYELYDPENHGYILYMELMKVFNVLFLNCFEILNFQRCSKLEKRIKSLKEKSRQF